MRDVSLFKKIVFSSVFLALFPAIVFLFLLPPLGSKYTVSIEPVGKIQGQLDYSDLNSDSVSERINENKGLPYYFVLASDHNLHYYDQWNLADSVNTAISTLFFGNYDHDLNKEIYIFTHKKDSLFLNINEILEHGGTKNERIYIMKIGYSNGDLLSFLTPVGFYDENSDGKDEVYFSVNSAFAMGPRKLFSIDLVNKKLNSSPYTGTIFSEPKMEDVDGDQKPEFFGTMSASGNFNTKVPYSDSSTWFMVFDDKLNFRFPPVEFPGFANALSICKYNIPGFKGYVLSHYAQGTDTTVLKSQIMIFSSEGKLITSRPDSDFESIKMPVVRVIKDHEADEILAIYCDKIFKLDNKLNTVRKINLPFKSQTYNFQADIDGDGKDELLIYSENDEKLIVYNAELSKLTEQKFKTPDPYWKISKYYSNDKRYKLFMKSGDTGYFLSLKKNDLYYLGYMAHPAIYLIFILFIFLIKRINTYQVVNKESLNRRLVTLQLQSIKSQLDPHFAFNSLNSVASLIYLEDRQAAYDYLIKFTQLLRGILNDAERIYRSLGEELEFVTNYLELEKMRFGEKFNYDIDIGEGISQKEKVPKMVLQTFAENAVKHGLMTCPNGGTLIIRLEKENDYLKLTIEDNGIGRAAAAGHSSSTGKGLKVTGEFYDILNQINKKPIKHLITDLYKETGEPSGTRVEVWVPVEE